MSSFETYKERILKLYSCIDCIENGILDKINEQTTIENMFILLKERSESNDIDKSVALFLLSYHYKKVDKEDEYIKCLKMSADLNLKEAMLEYSIVSTDNSYAIEASKMGYSEASNYMGIFYFNDKNISKMIEYYNLAIEQGNVLAINNYGKYFENKGDIAKAKELYQRAINLNNSTAKLNYARLLFSPFNKKFDNNKNYTEEDRNESFKLLEEAIEQDNIFACVELLAIYSNQKLNPLLTPEQLETKLIETCNRFVTIYKNNLLKYQLELNEMYKNVVQRLAFYYLDRNRELSSQFYDESIKLNDAIAMQKYASTITIEELEKYFKQSGIDDVKVEESIIDNVEIDKTINKQELNTDKTINTIDKTINKQELNTDKTIDTIDENVCLFIALFYNINILGSNGRNGLTRKEMIYKYLIPASNTNVNAQYFLGKLYKNDGNEKEMLKVYNKNCNKNPNIANELAIYYKEKGNVNLFKYFGNLANELKKQEEDNSY